MKKIASSCFGLLIICITSFAQMEFCWVGEYENGLALVKKNDKYGYINRNGEIVIPLRYSAGSAYRQGEAMIMVGSAHEYTILKIDTLGSIVWSFEEGLQSNDNKNEFINLNDFNYQVMSASGLVIRNKPALDGIKIAIAPYKANVRVLNKTYNWITIENIKSQWVEVEFNGIRGFCFFDFLTQVDVDKFNYFFRNNWINEYRQKSHWKLKKGKFEEMIFLEEYGVFVISSGMPETCARGQTIYYPEISMQEAFVLIKAACPDCMVILETGERGYSSRSVNLNDFCYPADSHQTSISFLLDNGLGFTTLTIEKDNNGYVRIKM